MQQSKIFFLAVLVAAAFVAGMNFSENTGQQKTESGPQVSKAGFTEVTISSNGTTISLSGICYTVSFDVTDDQAYSIAHGIDGTIGLRPLTHDIMKDIIDNFWIEITDIMIDRYENDIYYATIYMKQGNRILELDARPSDSIAMSLRTGVPVYFRNSILQEQGVYVCQGRT